MFYCLLFVTFSKNIISRYVLVWDRPVNIAVSGLLKDAPEV